MGVPAQVEMPLRSDRIASLKAGDQVLLSGTVYTARDAAHARLSDSIKRGEQLPFSPNGAVIYYVGPCPAKPGCIIGAAGPTTSGRMDPFVPTLMGAGIRGMIGKGNRGEDVIKSIQEYGGIYFVTVGGAGAYLAARIVECELVAFPDLGAEAIYKLTLQDFPAVVAIDAEGRNIFDDLKKTGR